MQVQVGCYRGRCSNYMRVQCSGGRACSGQVRPGTSSGGYCRHWDIAATGPWCYVNRGVCSDERNTYNRSHGLWWSYKAFQPGGCRGCNPWPKLTGYDVAQPIRESIIHIQVVPYRNVKEGAVMDAGRDALRSQYVLLNTEATDVGNYRAGGLRIIEHRKWWYDNGMVQISSLQWCRHSSDRLPRPSLQKTYRHE